VSHDAATTAGAVHRRLAESYGSILDGEAEAALAMVDADVVDHRGGTLGDRRGRDAMAEMWEQARRGELVDVTQDVVHNAAADSISANLYWFAGTHATSGRHVGVYAMDMVRVEDGRVVEHWGPFRDSEGMLIQLETSEAVALADLANLVVAFWNDMRAQAGIEFGNLLRELELSIRDVEILRALGGAESPVSCDELAELVGMSPSMLANKIDGLVSRGWVTTALRDAQSRELSDAGRATVERLADARQEGVERYLERIDPVDRTLLARALARLPQRNERFVLP